MRKLSLFIVSLFSLFSCVNKEKQVKEHLQKIKNSTTAAIEADEIALLHQFIGKNNISFEARAFTNTGIEYHYPDFFKTKEIQTVKIDFYIKDKDTIHFDQWKPKSIQNFFYLYNE